MALLLEAWVNGKRHKVDLRADEAFGVEDYRARFYPPAPLWAWMRKCEVSQSRITWRDMTIGRETLRVPGIPDSTPPIGWKPPGTLALDSRASPANLIG